MSGHEIRVVRWVLATIWIVTAFLSYGLYPMASSLLLVEGLGLTPEWSLRVVHAGASVDAVLGAMTLFYPSRVLWAIQGLVIVTYTLLATVLVPEYWLHPFGPLLKNLAILALLWLLWRHDGPETRIARIA